MFHSMGFLHLHLLLAFGSVMLVGNHTTSLLSRQIQFWCLSKGREKCGRRALVSFVPQGAMVQLGRMRFALTRILLG